MKKVRNLLMMSAVCATGFVPVACSSDSTEPGTSQEDVLTKVTLTAYQGDGQSTRLGFDGNGDAYWQSSDEIGVLAKGETSTFTKFTLDKGAGTGTAQFSGMVKGGVGDYAVYPYNANHSISGTTLTYYLPSNYTYTKVDNVVPPTDKTGNSFQAPMVGKVSNKNVDFTHMGGVICVVVDKLPATEGTVTVTDAANQLCGSFTSTALTETNPTITTTTSESDRTVTFNYSGATADEKGVFYLPVALGTYNLTVTVAGGSTTSSSTYSNIEIIRQRLQVMNVTMTSYAGDELEGFTKVGDYTYEKDGHTFVDLGLDVLWATMNVGASKATEGGTYFAWGETSERDGDYTWVTYGPNNGNSSYDSTADETWLASNTTDGVLNSSVDAATKNWGADFRMPTQSEMVAFAGDRNTTSTLTWTWKESGNTDYDGVAGYEVKNGTTGASVFLPVGGCKQESTIKDESTTGNYWTSSIYSSAKNKAYCVRITDSAHLCSASYNRYEGHFVRPVIKKPTK